MRTAFRYIGLASVFTCVGALGAYFSDLGRAAPQLHQSLQGNMGGLGSLRLRSTASASSRNLSRSPALDGGSLEELPGIEWSLGDAFREGQVMTGATPHRLILFTFDDGPDVRYTPAVLHELERANVRAVFFLTARRIRGDTRRQRARARIARDMVRRGHILANHTYDHAQLTLINNEEVVEQIKLGEQVFTKVLGGRPWLFRPPGGSRSARVDRLIEARGYTTVMWNLGTGDTQVHSAYDVLRTWKKVFERREKHNGDRGGIVLLHDTHEWSALAFRLIFSELQRRNCKLLEQGEELYDVVDDPSFFFTARKNASDAKAGTEAPPARLNPALLESRQRRVRLSTANRCRSKSKASSR